MGELLRVVTKRPYVLINVAATADGKIDTRERRGAAISSERDRERVDALRASVDAIMVGGRTLHDEDPRLTVKSSVLRRERLARGAPENPAKVGIASRLNLRADSRFLSSGPARIILFTARDGADPALTTANPAVEQYELGANGRVDLDAALGKLHALGIRRLLVEGGGTLNFELLRHGLVDELQLFIAPLIFGGAQAPTLADGEGLLRAAAIELGVASVEQWTDGGVLLRYMVVQS
jgi:2,5-diamino-6-(ribosylamino)-4(3H)-pyrimidinone 5'-phosphate reductase